jgi:predicted outer membrane protein
LVDRLYIDTQVMVHTEVLQTLDEVLIPSAQDASLKSELTATRAEVKAHLDQAKAVADSLAR